jgi:hypothetical protein
MVNGLLRGDLPALRDVRHPLSTVTYERFSAFVLGRIGDNVDRSVGGTRRCQSRVTAAARLSHRAMSFARR